VAATFAPDVVVVDEFWPDDHMGVAFRLMKRLAVESGASFVIGLPREDADGDLPGQHADVVAVIGRDEGGILLTLHKNRRGPIGAFLTQVPAPWKHQ